MKKFTLILLLLFLATSCVTHEEKMQKNLHNVWSEYFSQDFDQTKTVEILVATNRKAKNETFTCEDSQFGVTTSDALKYGLCKINVPKNHTVGEIELAKDNRQSSQNFFKILGADAWQQKDLIAALKKYDRRPLVFVHGFNVRYQEAILRAAQIAYDLKYQGPIILFTWPAGAGEGFVEDKMLNKTYSDNAANARSSVLVFKNFLLDLQKNDIQVNLVVHSMGHQVALPALKYLAEAGQKKTLIHELVLNAPDFEVTEFRSFSKNLKKVADHTTLYCSQNDKAMLASKTFNNNARLGACAFVDGVDVINVGLIDDPTIGLGHGYYSSRAILGDLFQTLLGIDVNKRLFISKSDPNSPDKYFLRK